MMRWIKNVAAELSGLFIDDWTFAGATLAWLVLVWLLFARLRLAGPAAIVLFAGLALILIESVVRYARNARRDRSEDLPR